MTGAVWVWALAGIVFVLVVGLLLVVALGLVGMPGDFLRRVRQTATAGRSERGGELPAEVPAASAEETARLVDDTHPT